MEGLAITWDAASQQIFQTCLFWKDGMVVHSQQRIPPSALMTLLPLPLTIGRQSVSAALVVHTVFLLLLDADKGGSKADNVTKELSPEAVVTDLAVDVCTSFSTLVVEEAAAFDFNMDMT